MSVHTSSRTYIRHPTGMPIEIRSESPSQHPFRRLRDISPGGLACCSPWPLVVDTVVNLVIPVTVPPFEAKGRVVWCERHGSRFELGIEFLASDDAFAARMVEQICHIEHYREEVLRIEGRVMDSDEAAAEWIARYADAFPRYDM